MDTIFALSSARGKAGVAVVRVTGPDARAVQARLTGRQTAPRQAVLCRIADDNDLPIDDCLALYFPEGQSFTGEPVVEFQCHGGVATVNALLDLLSRQDGLRLAEPGEFTRRALENECLDLAQVEGLADLIDAETAAQRTQALRLLSGALGDLAEAWRTDLIRAVALIEATIDFADEEVPTDVQPEVDNLLAGVMDTLASEIAGAPMAERIREGFEVAIVGPPNVGKSTLLNRLAGRDAAITSEIAGTTRDVIEVRMEIAGLPVTLLDTAGLRETGDTVEQIGVARARSRAEGADLRVMLIDGPASAPEIPPRPGDIVLRGKADLAPGAPHAVSGLTGEGVDDLVSRIESELSDRVAGAGTAAHARHRDAMMTAHSAISTAREMSKTPETPPELVADELYQAIRALDALVGRVDVEHILDEIFASFCIGK